MKRSKELRLNMKEKYYITTAIDYVNAKPHIGHAYEKIIADVLARWNRIKGKDVFYLTGTDENAQKNAQAAEEAKKDVKKFVDENVKYFIDLCKKLNLSNDYFIRTTEKRHIKISQEIFSKVLKKGDIYKGTYEGLYCQGCEAFITEKELVNGKCPEHNKEPRYIKEENYFFKMSKYENQMLDLLSKPGFVFPDYRGKEMYNRVKEEGLKDLCVSRKGTNWGIELPNDKGYSIYVWFDALINYISALDYPDGELYKKFWPADAHLIGKGINWFHSVIWPTMLMSAGIKLPKQIVVHGYLTVDGQKISKSLGNTIDPIKLVNKYGADPIRYVLIRDIPSGEDGDFSEKILTEKINSELANGLGNLISRSLGMTEKYFEGRVPKGKNLIKFDLDKLNEHFDKIELHLALAETWKYIDECNKFVEDKKPWVLAKENDKELSDVIYSLLDSIRIISILINPFIPETSEKINKKLGIKLGNYKDVKPNLLKQGIKVEKGESLFNKVEAEK
ncbi:MAG: methionine--tRNA ligase [Candidatus Nanoarchaeia archaeon]|nr:methionine--tRNA ligase [Candidatus Nanoarchaeia archaeon]